MMTIASRSQKIAQATFERISVRVSDGPERANAKKYLSFARSFPTLIHTSGLAQAVAFAKAKGVKDKEKSQLLHDLSAVIQEIDSTWGLVDGNSLDSKSRTEPLLNYMRLSRVALQSATWLKRYAEALMAGEEQDTTGV